MEHSNFLNKRKAFESVTKLTDVSVNPLEILKDKGKNLFLLDLELDSLFELNKGQAGYRESFNQLTNKKIGSGTTQIRLPNVVQFAMGKMDPTSGSIVPGSRVNYILNAAAEGLDEGSFWEGTSKSLKDVMFGRAPVPAGSQLLSRTEFDKAVMGHLAGITRDPNNLISGYNIRNADVSWLEQMGVQSSRIRGFDMLRHAQLLMPEQGYVGGGTLESVSNALLGETAVQTHDAADDIVKLASVAGQLYGKKWQEADPSIRRHILFNMASSLNTRGITSGVSETAAFFRASKDPYLFSRYKLDSAKSVFKTVDGQDILGTVIHSGERSGMRQIYNILKKRDPFAASELFKLHKFFKKTTEGRLRFALETRGNLDYLYLYSVNSQGETIATESLPFVQDQIGTAITYRNRLLASRRIQLQTEKGPVVTSFAGADFRAMRETLRVDKNGGLEVRGGSSNLNEATLRAIVGNAERRRIFTNPNDLDDGAVTIGAKGRVSRSSLLTNLRYTNLNGRINWAAFIASDVELQIAGVRVKEAGANGAGATTKIVGMPQIERINEVTAYYNSTRALEVSRGAADRSYNGLQVLDKAAREALDYTRALGLSAQGIKPEDVQRQIFGVGGGIHLGISERALTKGSFAFRTINLLDYRADIAPMIVPRGFASRLDKVRKLSGATTIPVPGYMGTIGVIQGSGSLAEQAAEARVFGEDPGVWVTKKGMRIMPRYRRTEKVHAPEIGSDLYEKLSPDQIDELSRRGSVLNFGVAGYPSIQLDENSTIASMVRDDKVKKLKLRPGQQIRSLAVRDHGITLEIEKSSKLDTHASFLVNEIRTTSQGLAGSFSDADVIGHSYYFKPSELEMIHYGSKVSKAGKEKELVEYLKGVLPAGHGLEDDLTEIYGKTMFGAPNVETPILTSHIKNFLEKEGIPYAPDQVTYSAKMMSHKTRGRINAERTVSFYDFLFMQRFGADSDLGSLKKGALKLRLQAVQEMGTVGHALGWTSGGPLYSLLKNKFDRSTGKAFDYLRSGLAGVNTGNLDELGKFDVLTFDKIRSGALKPVSASKGGVPMAALRETFLYKYRHSGFVLDLGTNIGSLPIGKGKAVGNSRYVWIPGAHLLGFGGDKGIGRISHSSTVGQYASALDLIFSGAQPQNVALALYKAQSSFISRLFGKGKLLEEKALTSGRVAGSMNARVIGRGASTSLEDLYTVDVDIDYLSRHKKILGLSDEYLDQIKTGGAFGYIHIDPRHRPEYSVLTRLRGVKRAQSKSILGISSELLRMLQRDVDKDVVRFAPLDLYGHWSDALPEGATAEQVNESLKIYFRGQASDFGGSLKASYEEMLSYAGKGKELSSETADFTKFLAWKLHAAAPWVRTRNTIDAMLAIKAKVVDMQKRGLDQAQMVEETTQFISRIFNFKKASSANPIVAKTSELVLEAYSGGSEKVSQRVLRSFAMVAETFQYALAKGGSLSAAATSLSETVAAQEAMVFSMLKNTKDLDPRAALEKAKANINAASRVFVEEVYKAKGSFNFGGQGTNIDDYVRSFSETLGTVNFAKGMFAGVSTAADTPEARQTFLGRASGFFSKLIRGRSDRSIIDLAMAGLDPMQMGDQFITESQAAANFEKHLPEEVVRSTFANLPSHKEAVAAASKDAGKARAMSKGAESVMDTIDNIFKYATDAWSATPQGVKYAAYALGGYAALTNLLDAVPGSDDEYMDAPPISSSHMMQNSLPRTPMVQEENIRYPMPQNPAQFKQKALIQRISPMYGFNGRIASTDASLTANNMLNVMGGAGIANGNIQIYDNRRKGSMDPSFEARNAINSDY